MINLIKKIPVPKEEQATLTLPLASRCRSRLRASLDDGRDVGLFLERGQILKNGDLLVSEEGLIVKVIAAHETVSTVICDDPLLITRASYHLGNRHVALQIEQGRLQYLHDHVLDNMLLGLGLKVTIEQAPFEPELGAYSHHSEFSHHHE